MARKYTGANASKLSYLPQSYIEMYQTGLLSDEEVDSLLEQVMKPSKPTASGIVAGPLTEPEQARAEGFVDAGGREASTAQAAGANLTSQYEMAKQGWARNIAEGGWLSADALKDQVGLGPLSVPASILSRIAGAAGADELLSGAAESVGSRLVPEEYTDPKEIEKQRAYREGQQMAISGAKERGGYLDELAIDLAGQATNAGTTIAALLARKPALAKGIAAASLTDLGFKVGGQSYEEAREAGLSSKDAASRQRDMLAVELLSESLNPAFDSVSVLKNLAKASVSGGVQEVLAEAGGMLVDTAKYDQLAPADIAEAGERLLRAGELGLIMTGALSGPAAYVSAKQTETERLLEAADGRIILKDRDLKAAFPDQNLNKAEQPALDEDLFGRAEGPAEPPKEPAKLISGTIPRATEADPNQIGLGLAKGKNPKPDNKDFMAAQKRAAKAQAAEQAKKVEQEAKVKLEEQAKAKSDAALQKKLKKQAEDEMLAKYPNAAPAEWRAASDIRYKALLKQAQQEVQATATPEVKPTTKTKAPTVAEMQANPSAKPDSPTDMRTRQEIMDELERTQAWSLDDKKSGGLSREAIIKKFVYDESKDGYTFRKALRSGKVKVARRASDVFGPQFGEAGDRAKGVHIDDSGQVYLFRENLKDEDVMGTTLHEVTHHAINKYAKKGAKERPSFMAGLATPEYIDKLATKITKQASDGNAVAKAAVARFENAKAVDPGSAINEELVAYFIEEGAKAREGKKMLGSARVALDDLVSKARVGLKEMTGLSGDVNINDLQVLARKMVDDMGKAKYASKFSNPNFKPTGKRKFSFIGKNSGILDETELLPTFLGSDGNVRREIDTQKIGVNRAATEKLFTRGEKVTVGELLNNADLLTKKAYGGSLGRTPVTFQTTGEPGLGGAFFEDTGEIVIYDNLLNKPSTMLDTVLHEVQHAIQAREGWERGTSPEQKMTRVEAGEVRRSAKKVEATRKRLTEKSALEKAAPILVEAANDARIPAAFKTQIQNLQNMANGTAKYDAFTANSDLEAVMDWFTTRAVEDRLRDSTKEILARDPDLKSYFNLETSAKSISLPAREAYMNERGEVEARAVENRRLWTRQEREAIPSPEATIEMAEGRSRANFTGNARPARNYKFSIADIKKLDMDNPTLQEWADQFSSIIKQKDRTIKDVRDLAEVYAQDTVDSSFLLPYINSEGAERDVKSEVLAKVGNLLVTPEGVDVERYLLMPDGTEYDPDNLAHIDASDLTKKIYELKKNGRLDSAKKQVAEKVTQDRALALQRLFNYLQGVQQEVNGVIDPGTTEYSSIDRALLIKAATKWSAQTVIKDGEPSIRLVEITPKNEVPISVVSGLEAAAIVEQLRQGKKLKEAVRLGMEKIMRSNMEAAKQTKQEGWVVYKKSDKEEDAVALNRGCAGRIWCTAGAVRTARDQLSQGDFHVYYKNGSPIVALRTRDGKLAEPPRGTLRDQGLTPEEAAIAEEALLANRVSGGQDFLDDQKVYKRIKELDLKTASKEELLELMKYQPKAGGYGNNDLPDKVLLKLFNAYMDGKEYTDVVKSTRTLDTGLLTIAAKVKYAAENGNLDYFDADRHSDELLIEVADYVDTVNGDFSNSMPGKGTVKLLQNAKVFNGGLEINVADGWDEGTKLASKGNKLIINAHEINGTVTIFGTWGESGHLYEVDIPNVETLKFGEFFGGRSQAALNLPNVTTVTIHKEYVNEPLAIHIGHMNMPKLKTVRGLRLSSNLDIGSFIHLAKGLGTAEDAQVANYISSKSTDLSRIFPNVKRLHFPTGARVLNGTFSKLESISSPDSIVVSEDVRMPSLMTFDVKSLNVVDQDGVIVNTSRYIDYEVRPGEFLASIQEIAPKQQTYKLPSQPVNVGVKFSIAAPDVTYGKDAGFGGGNEVAPMSYEIAKLKGTTSKGGITDRTVNLVKALGWKRVPTAFLEARARERGEVNGYALNALNTLNKLNAVIDGNDNSNGALEMIREYENVEDRQARVAKAAEFKAAYPEVFEAYNAARRNIVQMTNEILFLMEDRRYKLTEQDRAVMQSMQNKLGAYLTTTYKALGPKKVRAQHLKWLYSTKEGKEKRDAAFQYARDHIFTFNKLEDKSEQFLRSLYDAVVPASLQPTALSDQLSRKELIAVLEQAEPMVSDDQLNKASQMFVEDLLRVGRAANQIGRAARIFRGGTQDMTIITPKTDVPKVIRELWGEQTNPVMNVFATLVKQGEFIAKAKSQFRMRNELMGKYLFDNQTSVPRGQAVQLTSKGMGPLTGLWTTPEVKTFLEAQQQAELAFSEIIRNYQLTGDTKMAAGDLSQLALGKLGWVGSNLKWFTVVWKPINWAYNYTGSFAQMMMNGNYFRHVKVGHKVAFADAPNAPFRQYSSDELQELVRNGVLDSSLAGEIQEIERESIIQGVLAGGDKPTVAHSKWKRFSAGVTDLYAGMDIWAKIANYYHEKDVLRKFYAQAGTPMTEEQLERITADRIRKTNFSYDQAWAPAKLMERNGLTTFFVYNAEVFRTTINNYRVGLLDISNGNKLGGDAGKTLRNHGIRRLVGATMSTAFHSAIFAGMANMAAALAGLPDEDEKEEVIKKGVADIFQTGLLRLVGKEGSTREYFDAGRLDPYGPLNEMLRAVADGDEDKIKKTVLGLVIWNDVLKSAIAVAKAKLTGENIRGLAPRFKGTAEDVYKEALNIAAGMGISEGTANASLRMAESLFPAVGTGVITQMLSDENKDDPLKRMLAASGARMIKYDPKEDLRNHAQYGYGGAIGKARQEWSEWAENRTSPTREEVATKYRELANAEFEAWSKARPKVEAASTAGLPLRVIQEQLKDGQMSAVQITSLMRGRFTPTVVTMEKLKQDEADDLKKAKPEDRKAIRDKYRLLKAEVSRLARNYKPYEE